MRKKKSVIFNRKNPLLLFLYKNFCYLRAASAFATPGKNPPERTYIFRSNCAQIAPKLALNLAVAYYMRVSLIFPIAHKKKLAHERLKGILQGSGFPLLESTFFAVHCLPRSPLRPVKALYLLVSFPSYGFLFIATS